MCDHCGCRAFAPIADLTAEHVEVLALAWQVAEDHAPSGTARLSRRDRLLSLLDRHVAKEELGLYPELSEVGALVVEDNARLEEEHRVVVEALIGGSFDRRDFYALAAHVEEEELELFSSAMLRFDEESWQRLEQVHHDVDHTTPTGRRTA
jgi:hemerythrin-like domain-containing protein